MDADYGYIRQDLKHPLDEVYEIVFSIISLGFSSRVAAVFAHSIDTRC